MNESHANSHQKVVRYGKIHNIMYESAHQKTRIKSSESAIENDFSFTLQSCSNYHSFQLMILFDVL